MKYIDKTILVAQEKKNIWTMHLTLTFKNAYIIDLKSKTEIHLAQTPAKEAFKHILF